VKSRFDFNSVSEITGAFVILAFVVVVSLVVVAARVQHWFEPVYELVVQLPGDTDVPRGAVVLIAGSTVGSVASVSLDVDLGDAAEGPDAATLVTLALQGELVQHLHLDSEARVITPLLPILGAVQLTLSKGGNDRPLLFPEGTRHARLATTAIADVDLESNFKVWNDKALAWEERFVKLYAKVERWDREMLEWNELFRAWEIRLASTYDRIDLMTSEPDGELYVLLTNTNALVEHLADEGLVGWALRDESWNARSQTIFDSTQGTLEETRATIALVRGMLAGEQPYPAPFDTTLAHLPAMAEQTEAVLGRLDNILAQVEVASRSLPRLASTIEQEASTLPGFLIESQETLRQVDALVRAIQQHWLLRSYVEGQPGPGRIPVEDVGAALGGER
jgi:hypothetical protein